MNIILIGGCNWLGKHLMNKLLSDGPLFRLTWVDNLSSQLSSRHFVWDFEYLNEDCFAFKYGDITNASFLESILTPSAIVIYNIWNQSSLAGFELLANRVEPYNLKLIYTTKHYGQIFQSILKEKNIKESIGIQYSGELIGDYGIWNKRDAIETIHYYNKIGNHVSIPTQFDYYTMESATHFIYFFILQDMCGNMLIQQPTQMFSSVLDLDKL